MAQNNKISPFLTDNRVRNKGFFGVKTMMNIWLKIEAILNKILTAIINAVSSAISKATPKQVKRSIDKTSDFGHQITENVEKNIDKVTQKAKGLSQEAIVTAKKSVDESKVKAQQAVIAAKTYDWKSLNFNKVSLAIVALLTPLLLKAKTWFINLKPATVLSLTVTTMVIGLTSISIVKQAGEIKDKTEDAAAREPASYSDTMDRNAWKKSEYHNHADKMLQLSSVTIPIYIENRKGMQSVIIDFTFVASNRYISKYFKVYEHEYLLRDRLNKELQPIIPSFPMEPEGKRILKTKIIDEMNKLIKDLKIQGEIKDIYIHSLLNG
jgi:hypothetical protein